MLPYGLILNFKNFSQIGDKLMKNLIVLTLALLFSLGVSLAFADQAKIDSLTKRAESVATQAEESAQKASLTAQRAETAANKAETAADRAEKAADKAWAIFEKKIKN
jgi:hypothetical protein